MFRRLIYPGYARLTSASRKASRRTSERGGFIRNGAVFSAVIGIDTNLTLAYQLFALLLCMIILSRIALRYQKPQVSLRRRLPRYATVGELFDYQISIANLGDQIEKDLRIVDNPRVITPDYEQFRREREPFEETRTAYDRWIGFHRFMWLQRRSTGISVKQANVPEIHRRGTVEARIEANPLRRGIVYFSSTSLLHPDPLGLNYGILPFPNPESLIILPR